MRNIFIVVCLLLTASSLYAKDVLLEAEHFANYGGWVHDSQFMNQMGSPFLMAHGLGIPVADAETKIDLNPGKYRVWVRTRDWVAAWNAPGTPGKFQVMLNGKALETTFGTNGADWAWQDGGIIDVTKKENTIALHDLTGFAGRCDAILFTTNLDAPPTNEPEKLKELRRVLLGFPEKPETAGEFDLVVVGGGIAGTCAAISAARQGLSVALIHDRPVLGGNNSSEVRVWLQGARNKAPFTNVGSIVAELEQSRQAHYGPTNTADLYEDEKKLDVVRNEKNISMFLEHFANRVEMDGKKIVAVIAEQTKTGKQFRFAGSFFADTTGDGNVGFMAGADFDMTIEEGHMGPCNLWNVKDSGTPQSFPRCPWALDLTDKPFPGRADKDPNKLGGWYWESGFYHDPIEMMEYVRDWNFRAAYGAWDALKNVDNAFPNHKLNWMAHISGKRESRRLLGDIVLSKTDLVENEKYEDGCVPTGWPIDLHLPDKKFEKGFEGDAFISVALYTQIKTQYWIPYRCLYSRNVSNLFMAGRCLSATHEGLGSARVMRTGGCMGEIVGLAAKICVQEKTTPRGVYNDHLKKLFALIENPGWQRTQSKIVAPSFSGVVGANIAPLAALKTSGERDENTSPKLLTDGFASFAMNEERWLSNTEGEVWVELKWEKPQNITAFRMVSGYNGGGDITDPIEDFTVTTESTAFEVKGNKAIDFQRRFEPVKTQTLRIDMKKFKPPCARIWEIEVYPVKE
ncbi:MAG: FAD-dependent oxidoreductase [Planctomycetaceae bacterium]|nr:FAD-dependent oxidoreductase [Planctomycetaceae bacterium]